MPRLTLKRLITILLTLYFLRQFQQAHYEWKLANMDLNGNIFEFFLDLLGIGRSSRFSIEMMAKSSRRTKTEKSISSFQNTSHNASNLSANSTNSWKQKLCQHLPTNLNNFRNCIKRIKQIEARIDSTFCLKNLPQTQKPDPCQIQEFLSHYEYSCPSPERSKSGKFSNKRNLKHEVNSLISSMKQKFGFMYESKKSFQRSSSDFIINRIEKFSFSWSVASFKINQLHNEMMHESQDKQEEVKMQINSSNRHQPWLAETLNILVFANFLTKPSLSHFTSQTEKIGVCGGYTSTIY